MNKIRTSKIIFNILFILSEAYAVVTNLLPSKEERIKKNYEAVKKFTKEDGKEYINGQGLGEVATLPFGKKTFSYCGCGAIATYNSLVTLGCKDCLADTAKYYETSGLILDGAFGIHPNAVRNYFEDVQCDVNVHILYNSDVDNNYEKFDEIFKDAKSAILLSWNSVNLKHDNGNFAGMHYVSISHSLDKDGNPRIDVYNAYSKVNHLVHYNSIESYIKTQKILPVVLFTLNK